MKEKNKIQRGFIQIPILIAIIVDFLAIGGSGYVAIKQHQIKQSQNYQDKITEETGQVQKLAEAQVKILKKEIEELKGEVLLIAKIKAQTAQSAFLATAAKPVLELASTPKTLEDHKTPNKIAINENVFQASGAAQSAPANSQAAFTSAQISALAAPSVVIISVPEGNGSGFVFSGGIEKYILTNAHVIGSNASVKIQTQDGAEFSATVLGKNEVEDLAIISTSGRNLPSLILGNSDSSSLAIGENVYALGFPFSTAGLINITFTTGVLSSRQNVDGKLMLQTDASINPGNSGGPLVNSRGEVIGINKSRLNDEYNAQGIGFAIPINAAKIFISKLIGSEF